MEYKLKKSYGISFIVMCCKTTIPLLYHSILLCVNTQTIEVIKILLFKQKRAQSFKNLSIENVLWLCYTISEERKVQSNENLSPDFDMKENKDVLNRKGKQ